MWLELMHGCKNKKDVTSSLSDAPTLLHMLSP